MALVSDEKSPWYFSWYPAGEDEFGPLQIKLLAPEFESLPLRHSVLQPG